MPPLVPRKRLRESPPPEESRPTKSLKGKFGTERRKATLYDDLDATATPQSSKNSNPALHDFGDDDDDDSSLTSLSGEEFEDVVPHKQDKSAESSDEEDIVFEDVKAPAAPIPDAPAPTGDLELTLIKDTRMSLTNSFGDKRGPTKRERQVRYATHGLHVLLLLWHNAIRNSWLCDPEVQATMISHLPSKLWDEVDRWRRNSGLIKAVVKRPADPLGKMRSKGKKPDVRKSRDWGAEAEKLEEGAIDRSHGDPLFRLMKILASWWKQRFRVTCPGLRKWGYMSLERLDRLTKAQTAETHDPERFGEKICDVEEFRQCARDCQGSRDVGAQLFTALLRGLGLEARMVANLQTLGFGWTKWEEAEPEKEEASTSKNPSAPQTSKEKGHLEDAHKPKSETKKTNNGSSKRAKRPSRVKKEAKNMIISDSDELELEYKDSDDESVVELEVTPRKGIIPNRKHDKELEFPHYWTEVLSPVTSKYLPVEVLVKNIIGTNRDLVEGLEPRGAKADKARQIMAYVMGYSEDGTAKDVTIRYLKRNLWPGRTKGMRMVPEKVPIYNRHGKVKRYEQLDWFKTAISGYRRGTRKHPITEVDEMEDATDLKPVEPQKKEVKEGQETLQYYKQSKDFVLERHLKREEALKPGAVRSKVFKNKGRGGKLDEEDVFLRSDVVQVKSAETWHKQGRAPIEGEQPLKRVPYRAATLNRKREIMEAEAATGEKVLQGLYSIEQTDWIIPTPIKDGIIPKNEYGNIDLFAKHMCPQGAAHVPYRGAMRVCKRLQIDYAEAVVDFEFGHRMAVPVIQGVVIAEENYNKVMAELEKDEAERIRKEDEKRRKKALAQWRRFLMGMRIAERIRQEYGEIDEQVSVFGHSRDLPQAHRQPKEQDEDMAGGFLPEGYEEIEETEQPMHHTSGFFAAADEDDDGDGGLVMEQDTVAQERRKTETEREEEAKAAIVQPVEGPEARGRKTTVQSSMKQESSRSGPRRSTRRRRTIKDDLGEQDEDGDEEMHGVKVDIDDD